MLDKSLQESLDLLRKKYARVDDNMVDMETITNKRTLRISTYLDEEMDDLIHDLIFKIKKKEGKKPKINEILERAIKKLYEEFL